MYQLPPLPKKYQPRETDTVEEAEKRAEAAAAWTAERQKEIAAGIEPQRH